MINIKPEYPELSYLERKTILARVDTLAIKSDQFYYDLLRLIDRYEKKGVLEGVKFNEKAFEKQ